VQPETPCVPHGTSQEFANVIDINTLLPSTIHVLGFELEVVSDTLNGIDLIARTI
jgi:hypothetical protein